MAHTMNASVWECDFWITNANHDYKCAERLITSDVYSDALPEGWIGVTLSQRDEGDSDYMLVCPKHTEWMTKHFGGAYVVWGA